MKHLACAFAVTTLVALIETHIPAIAQEPPEIVPGEVVVGVDPKSDSPANWRGNASTVGTTAEYIRTLHVYRIKLRQGMNIEAAINTLRKRRDVAYAEPNHVVHAVQNPPVPNDPDFGTKQYGPQRIQADFAWGAWTPTATTILCICDTGVDYTHPDLTNKIYRDGMGIVIGYNSIGSNAHSGNPADPIDDHGHGTHCAGIAAGETNNLIGISGIAGWSGQAGSDTTNTRIMPVKVLNNFGSGTTVTVANGITWAADHGARIISMSLGGGGDTTEQNAVAYAWGKGVLVVAAAGNSGSNGKFYPAGYPNVLSVAATQRTDTLTFYSNYGGWVQCAAPGGANSPPTDSIWSSLPTYTAGGNFGTNYGYLSGTSMACPHVAGLAALLFSQNPALTNLQVKDLIGINTDAYTPYYGSITPRGGRVNAYKALLAVKNNTPQPPPEPMNLVATGGNTTISLTWSASSGATGYRVYRATTSGGPYGAPVNSASTSFTDTSLTNCTTYYYAVSAVNAVGESLNSFEASTNPSDPLAVPAPATGLSAFAGDGYVSLYWTGNGCATGFNLYRGTSSGGPYSSVGNTASTSFYDGTVTDGTTYYYVVRAANSNGESGNSNEASATPVLQPPPSPYNLVATAGDTTVGLTWTGSTKATSYNVYRATVSGGPYSVAGSPTATSFTDTGLTNGTTYYYVVTGVNAAGEGPRSGEASATPKAFIPAAPTNLVATPSSAKVSLTWNASTGATSYNVYRGTTSGGPYGPPVNVATNSYADTTVTNGVTYYYVVTALNGNGASGNSNQVSAMPQQPPNAPSNLRVTKTLRSEVDLAWNDNSGNETGFVVQISTDGGVTFSDYLSPVGPNVTTFSATGLARRYTFFFRVRATGNGVDSAYSNVVSGKTKG